MYSTNVCTLCTVCTLYIVCTVRIHSTHTIYSMQITKIMYSMYRMNNITFVLSSLIPAPTNQTIHLQITDIPYRQTSVTSAAQSTHCVDIASGSVLPVAQWTLYVHAVSSSGQTGRTSGKCSFMKRYIIFTDLHILFGWTNLGPAVELSASQGEHCSMQFVSSIHSPPWHFTSIVLMFEIQSLYKKCLNSFVELSAARIYKSGDFLQAISLECFTNLLLCTFFLLDVINFLGFACSPVLSLSIKRTIRQRVERWVYFHY